MPKHKNAGTRDLKRSTPKSNQLPSKAPSLQYLPVKKASLVFRAINHKLRQEMIRFIDARGTVSVTEIFVEMRLEQSVASQHLAILRRAGIVRTERDGKFIFYSVNRSRIGQISSLVEELAA